MTMKTDESNPLKQPIIESILVMVVLAMAGLIIYGLLHLI
jgi:hypothetical protein